MKVKIKYDLKSDGEILTMKEAGLKEVMEIPSNIEEDQISNWISNETGWCIFNWEEIKD